MSFLEKFTTDLYLALAHIYIMFATYIFNLSFTDSNPKSPFNYVICNFFYFSQNFATTIRKLKKK